MTINIDNFLVAQQQQAEEEVEKAEQLRWDAECERLAWSLLKDLKVSNPSLFDGDFPITFDDFLGEIADFTRKQNPRACDIAWTYYNHLVY